MARASNTNRVKVGVKIDGLDEGIRAMRRLDADAKKEVRAASKRIAERLVGAASSLMSSLGPQAGLVAGTFKAMAGDTPTIKAAGAKKITPDGATAGQVWFGVEFGGGARRTTRQFQPHRGKDGYAFWPTVRAQHDQIRDDYLDAVAQAAGPDWKFH